MEGSCSGTGTGGLLAGGGGTGWQAVAAEGVVVVVVCGCLSRGLIKVLGGLRLVVRLREAFREPGAWRRWLKMHGRATPLSLFIILLAAGTSGDLEMIK